MPTISEIYGYPWHYPDTFSPEDYTHPETYRYTKLPTENALTLIPDAYRNAAFYRIEQERVYHHSWVAVGYTHQVAEPGQVLVTEVAGQGILVTRDKDGNLQAFYNVCRHRGARLMKASGSIRHFRCPYHSWGYDLKGTCIGTPLFEGSDIPQDQQAIFDMTALPKFDKADYGLLPVRVASWGFLVFVNLDPEAAPLHEWLGDLPTKMANYRLDEWVIVAERPYQFRANWKLVAENYIECYHLPWVHPELIRTSRVEDHYRWQGPGMYTGMVTWPVTQDKDSGWLDLPPVSSLSEKDAQSGRFIWLFPNVAISVLPNHTFVMLLTPNGHAHTDEMTALLVHPESQQNPSSQTAIDKLVKFWDLVNTQDIEIVEEVQKGLEVKAYQGGRMCYHFEHPIRRFQLMVVDKMLGEHTIPPGDDHELVPMFDKRWREQNKDNA